MTRCLRHWYVRNARGERGDFVRNDVVAFEDFFFVVSLSDMEIKLSGILLLLWRHCFVIGLL